MRQPVNNDFGTRLPAVQAQPIFQTEQVQSAAMRSQGLADAFAQGELLIDQTQKRQAAEDEARAKRFASSVTVDELGKRVKSGEMLASESPVFAATLQHIWGANAQAAAERDVLGKVTRGDMKFNSAQEVDQWLTESRNTALAGHGEYAAAGYDKAGAAFRQKLMDSVAQTNDKQVVQQAANEATDFLANKLLEVSTPDFKGTPQDAAGALLNQYQLLRRTKTLPDATAREALQEMIVRAASGGNKALVGALLDSELPDVGKVRNLVGETKSATLVAHAETKFDQAQRKRLDDESLPWYLQADRGELQVDKFMQWATDPTNKDYTTSAFIHSVINHNQSSLAHQQRELGKAQLQRMADASVYQATQSVEAAAARGALWEVQGTNTPKVYTETGAVKEFNVKDAAEAYLKRSTANLPFDQQVSAWALNGLTNPDWDAQLKAGLNNLATIGLDSKGKPTGQLNEAGQKAIDLFRQLDSVNPDAARQMAGETAHKRFSDIVFLTTLGRTPADAAAIATNSASGAIETSDVGKKLVAKVNAAVDDMTARPWYKPAWAAHLMGENTTANTAQVTGTIRRYATLLARSGQYGDAESATAAASEYLSNPKVSAKVNGTVYLRSELPQPPGKGESQEEWFGRFLDAVPKAAAKAQGFKDSEVRLEYDPTAKGYRPMVAGVPLLQNGEVPVYSRDDIKKWFDAEYRKDQLDATSGEKAYQSFRKRIWSEIGVVQRDQGPYAIEEYDPTYGHNFFERNLMSRQAFDQMRKDGNHTKPLGELMKLYPNRKRGDK